MKFELKGYKNVIILCLIMICGSIYLTFEIISKFGIFHEESMGIPIVIVGISYLCYIFRHFMFTYKIEYQRLNISFFEKEIVNKKLNDVYIFDLGNHNNTWAYHIILLVDKNKYTMIVDKQKYFEFKQFCKIQHIELLEEKFIDIYMDKNK